MYGFNNKVVWCEYGCESWTLKKAERRRIDAFELWCWRRLLRVPCKEIQLVHPKGSQSWIFIGRTDAEAEIPTLWSPDVKNWLIGKDPDARKEWRQEEKGMTENEMVGWHYWLDRHECEQILGGRKEPGMLQSMQSQSWTQLSDWTILFIKDTGL